LVDERKGLETKVEELASQVRTLKRRVDVLESSPGLAQGKTAGKSPRSTRGSREADPRERLWTMGGMTAILSRIATICFLLVIALILRTLTDNGFVGMQFGSVLGISFAWILIAGGWLLYRRSSPAAPIFAISGALLLFTVVLETHAHFGALSSLTAYPMLMIAGTVLTTVSRWQKVAVPVTVAALGIVVTALPLDFPDPIIPYLCLVLLFVNVITYTALNISRCWWLRIFAFFVTIFVMGSWAFKLSVVLRRGDDVPAALYIGWFFPILVLFLVYYISTALLSTIRFRPENARLYNDLLPTLASVLIFIFAWVVAASSGGRVVVLGAAGIILWAGLSAVAVFLAMRTETEGEGVNSFAFPAACLFALSLPLVFSDALFALPVISALGLGYLMLSGKWDKDAVRITSYLIQITVIIAAAGIGVFSVKGMSLPVGMVSAGLFTVVTFSHFKLSRRRPPAAQSGYFVRFDKRDRSALLVLFASLLGAFFTARTGVYWILSGMKGDIANAFTCAQSIIINLGAVGLILKAYSRKDYEIRSVAILVTVIGALKVFLIDLLSASGVPLVLSVLSFGIAAALGSVILGRWHRKES